MLVLQADAEEKHDRYVQLLKDVYVSRMNEVAFPGALSQNIVTFIFASPSTTFLVYRGLLAQPGWRQIHVRLVSSRLARAGSVHLPHLMLSPLSTHAVPFDDSQGRRRGHAQHLRRLRRHDRQAEEREGRRDGV